MNYSEKNLRKKRLSLRSKGDRRRSSFACFCIIFLLFFLVTVSVIGVGFLVGSVEGIFVSTPREYDLKPKYSATLIYDDAGNPVQYLSDYDSNRIIVMTEDIPKNLKNAFIAIEDERFYEHNGVDTKGILRALVNDVLTGSLSQGASTITQQLVKNNVFNVGGERNNLAKIKRKLQECHLAILAEKEYTKEEILTDYLNTINLGKGTLGIQAASKYYLGKSIKNLTLSECAVLAGITKNPSYLNPVDYPSENNDRRCVILKKMLELKLISSDQYQEAIADEEVYNRIQDNMENRQQMSTYSYFTDALILQIVDDLQKKLGYTQSKAYELVYRGGLKIYSTQDTQMQKCADSVINDKSNYPTETKYSLEYTLEVKHEDQSITVYKTSDLKKYFKKKKNDPDYSTIYSSKKSMNQAAAAYKKAVVKDTDTVLSEKIHYSLQPQLSYTLIDHKTGQVKVLVGGRGKKQDDLALNRATGVTRQPGSTFKVVSSYAPALDTGGMTLATVFDDAPYKYESGKSVQNYERKHFGLLTIRDAIMESNNVIAVKTLTKLTPQIGFNYLLNLGFTTLVQNRTTNGSLESDVNQSLALGGITDGVTNLELTASYAAIANKGEYTAPYLYTKIVDNKGEVILENKTESTRVMKKTTAWLLTSAMEDVVKKGTGKEAQLSSSMGVAGKTGTTSNNYDYWFSGFTPYYTASIWTGYDYNTDYGKGYDYHKEIWAKIMDKIIEKKDQEIKGFGKCKSIVKVKICAKSGKLAIDKICDHDPEKSMVREEYFEKGTEPKESCDTHVVLTFCKKSKKIATAYCPTGKNNKKLYTKIYRKRPAGSTGTTDDTPYCLNFNPKKNVCPIHTKEWLEEKEKKKKLLEEQKKQEASTQVPANQETVPVDKNP